jgi:hypothetical protein
LSTYFNIIVTHVFLSVYVFNSSLVNYYLYISVRWRRVSTYGAHTLPKVQSFLKACYSLNVVTNHMMALVTFGQSFFIPCLILSLHKIARWKGWVVNPKFIFMNKKIVPLILDSNIVCFRFFMISSVQCTYRTPGGRV